MSHETMERIYYVQKDVIPVALCWLPARMSTPEAIAMLLAIGLQESKFEYRKQVGGPAKGFWQFEMGGGVRGVLTHGTTGPLVLPVLKLLGYSQDSRACYDAIQHNDVLAAVFARLLLWATPGRLPTMKETEKAWLYYLDGWRPGKPHPQTWEKNFNLAWDLVTQE